MTEGIRKRQWAGVIILTRILRDFGWGGPDGACYGGGRAEASPGVWQGWKRRKAGRGKVGNPGVLNAINAGCRPGLLGRVVIFTVIPACAGIQRRNLLLL